MVINIGILPLSTLFRASFLGIAYNAPNARSHLLQMPLVALRMGSPSSGHSQVQVMEYLPGIDYVKLEQVLTLHTPKPDSAGPSMTKEKYRQLLSFAQSRRERETLTYAVYKASGLNATAARKQFGIENIAQRAMSVEESLQEAQNAQECIDSLCQTQDESLLRSFGILVETSSSS